MSNESEVVEIKYFNVKNTSLRLVHIGGVSIPPSRVEKVVDDELGINRKGVEDSEYLEETEDEIGVVAPEVKVKKPSSKSNTPTGKGWTAK